MKEHSQARPFGGERRLEVRLAEIPCPELNRFFYMAVGADSWWHTRLHWNCEQWLDYVDRPDLKTWIGMLSGNPVGYFELESQPGNEIELVYFGLLPSFIGLGLGPELLSAAIESAWRDECQRLWLHTCTLDHPRALPNYQAAGFTHFKTEEMTERLPDQPLDFWPTTEGG